MITLLLKIFLRFSQPRFSRRLWGVAPVRIDRKTAFGF